MLLVMVASGSTGLVYEVVWGKYLELFFGATTLAHTVVLAAFMSGLAIGNAFFGARADRTRRPLALYGALEIGIGLLAAAVRSRCRRSATSTSRSRRPRVRARRSTSCGRCCSARCCCCRRRS